MRSGGSPRNARPGNPPSHGTPLLISVSPTELINTRVKPTSQEYAFAVSKALDAMRNALKVRSWRLWSLKSKLIACTLLLGAVVGVAAYYAKLTQEPLFGAISASLAVGSLFVAAASAYSAVIRAKRKDTLEAWKAWSDGHSQARRYVTDVLGAAEISDAQALALTANHTLQDKNGKDLSSDDRQKLREHIADILNGLERLAVGVELGIYDEDVLRLIGGTIIVRTFERFEPYIINRRTRATTRTRQSRAYTELEVLVKMIESTTLKERIQGDQRAIDDARLKALHRPAK